MSGCAICVHDLYQEALSDYQASTSSLRDSLRKLHISEDQWPLSIRTEAPKELAKNIRLSASEELERKLKEKHEKQVHDEPLG